MITDAEIIFWDFDGVIKESVSIKTNAYLELFKPYGENVQKQVKKHHEANGGISRYDKIPYYFKEYVGKEITKEEASYYNSKFSKLVLELVIQSPWVPGVEVYLRNNIYKQKFIVVTGTPQDEIEIILKRLNLTDFFESIWGAPQTKVDIVKNILKSMNIEANNTLFIGDSKSDLDAAIENNVPFILRETDENMNLLSKDSINSIKDFTFLEGIK